MKKQTYLFSLLVLLVAVLGSFVLQVFGVMGKTRISPNLLLMVILVSGLIFYYLKKKAEKEPWFGKKKK